MEYRVLGRTGMQVSELCLGTMSFGAEADATAARAMFDEARDAGINFFDTADVYGMGRSEEILGKLVADSRDELVIATKGHFPTRPDRNSRGLSRRHLRQAVEASLKRLGTDRIDLYYAHGFDELTPIEEVVSALDSLVQQGKVLYLGVSNWAAWQIATALGVSTREARARFQCIQPMYNLVKRQAEVELIPMAHAEGLGVVTYSPLGGGLLSGKYAVGVTPKNSRLHTNEMYALRYRPERYRKVAEKLMAEAASHDVHTASLAVAWVMNHPHVTAPILGARNVQQLRPALAAASIAMTAEWREELSDLAPEPPPPTDRLEETMGYVYGTGKK